MKTHYDANDPYYLDYMDDILEPGDTDQHGNRYSQHDEYEAEQQRQADLATNQNTDIGLEMIDLKWKDL